MKKCNCPSCGKELVSLEPNINGSSSFWCDSCCIDVRIDLPDSAVLEEDAMAVEVREIKAGQLYRHFKGTLYRVMAVAEHTESGQSLVVYHAESAPGKVWVRPLTMFMSAVNREKYPTVEQNYRFELVNE